MRNPPPALQAALDAEATTFCHAWKLVRRDGRCLGFTDHDEDLVFDGVTFSADAGLAGAAAERLAGFAADAAEVSGAFRSDALTEADLANGLYDGASVETWLVDWRAPESRLLLDVASLGETTRGAHAFTAQLRGLGHALEREAGRRFQRACAADLGDARCRVDLSAPRFTMEAPVVAVTDAGRCATFAGDYATGWFTGGRLRVLTGANAGATAAIQSHRRAGDRAHFALWSPLAQALAIGDRIRVEAGCDKSFAACGEKFANRANFRGFPHMPDEALVLAQPGGVMDGGSFFV